MSKGDQRAIKKEIESEDRLAGEETFRSVRRFPVKEFLNNLEASAGFSLLFPSSS